MTDMTTPLKRRDMNEKISIAMTAYNGELYVAQQLQSIIQQTIKADEVIIFDDHSTDKTADIITDFIKTNELDHWIFSINKENIGFARNFYQAIEGTTGDIIFLCDHDDVWHDNKIETMLDVFQTHDEVKMLNTSFDKIDGNGNILNSKNKLWHTNHNIIRGKIKQGSMKQIDFRYIIWRNISPGCTSAFRSECKIIFLESFSGLCPHDWELNIFGAALDGLFFLNKSLIKYRLHANNAIGLPKQTLKKKSSEISNNSKMITTAKYDYERACSYINSVWQKDLNQQSQKVLEKFLSLTKTRYMALSERRFTKWLRIICHIHVFILMNGIQGFIGDIKFFLRY